jgi:hypothetical protein
MITRDIAPGIIGYTDVFSESLNYVKLYEKVQQSGFKIWFEEGTNSHGKKNPEYNPSVRSTLVTFINPLDQNSTVPGLSQASQLANKLDEVRDLCLSHYKTIYGDMNIIKKEGWALLKYRPGDFFQNHTDASHEYPRQVSAVFYFNDNYEGGELIFPFLNVTIKAKAGELILFPSNYLFVHKANKVESGIKYSAISFMN